MLAFGDDEGQVWSNTPHHRRHRHRRYRRDDLPPRPDYDIFSNRQNSLVIANC